MLVQPYLMEEVGEVEVALFELTYEHQARVKEEIRSKISALETALVNESQNSTSALLRVEKYKETRQELDKKLDTQYQRRIAEALDNHLTVVRRDRELRSQIEERKIRSDAAYEEAKRKVALQEEKQQQEKAKAEGEANLRAEEAKRAALEAERKAAMEAKRRAAMEDEKRAATEAERRAQKEAIERGVTETSKRVASKETQQETAGRSTDTVSSLSNADTKESGNIYRAAASGLNLDHGRLQKLKEQCERNQMIRSVSFTASSSFDKTISCGKNEIERGRPFILLVDEYEMEDTESEDEDDKALVTSNRFSCDQLYLSDSDDSDIVSAFEVQPYLMEEMGEVEGALFELTYEHQLRVKEEIRNKISALETALANESQNSTSALLRVEKYKETRQELDIKLDTQYQRRIAKALDNHLTAVQRDRELRSQIEERKIRSDAAYEVAKRKVALQEGKK